MNTYLFVCSGNKMRSPTAEHVARSLGYFADSAGSRLDHDPVRFLTREAIDRARHIICMEQEHAEAVLNLQPHCAGRLQVWDIPDVFDYCDPVLIDTIRQRLEGRGA